MFYLSNGSVVLICISRPKKSKEENLFTFKFNFTLNFLTTETSGIIRKSLDIPVYRNLNLYDKKTNS